MDLKRAGLQRSWLHQRNQLCLHSSLKKQQSLPIAPETDRIVEPELLTTKDWVSVGLNRYSLPAGPLTSFVQVWNQPPLSIYRSRIIHRGNRGNVLLIFPESHDPGEADQAVHRWANRWNHLPVVMRSRRYHTLAVLPISRASLVA